MTHVVAQDHRAVKRVPRPLLGCKSFAAAEGTLAGIALMPRRKQGHLVGGDGAEGLTAAEQFDALTA